ncbi:hypothetical protein [Jiangella alba]|uniref:Uncharacterized protein n=1 Tax=Jiangella alba TaxID=561176 RepID=A0A1H5J6M4_9ACTN|nr:hypothetical protein [Jiangella alba]SEE47897.1 hypothetical protein SAMN04488561_1454 [Jiangella alba]
MTQRSNRWLALSVAAAALASCGDNSQTDAEVSSDGDTERVCAAPLASVTDTTIAPSDPLEITAVNLVNGCYDQGEGITAEPLHDQSVTWQQDGKRVELAVVDAQGTDGTVKVTVEVPTGAQAGAATITVGGSNAVEVTVAP